LRSNVSPLHIFTPKPKHQLASRIYRTFLRGFANTKMPSPAITRLDAAKSSLSTTPNVGGTTATANVTTSTNPQENAAATAANTISHDPKLATGQTASVTNAANVIEGAKQLAAYAAVDHHILPHHKVCRAKYPTGSALNEDPNRLSVLAQVCSLERDFKQPTHLVGSTVPYVVDRIVQQGKEANTGRVFIPTGVVAY
jgi:ribose 5-phosphate isomerase A